MVSFAIDIAVHPNAIVLPFIALPTSLQHLDIVGFLDIAREEVWILRTLLLCFFVCSRPVFDSIELCDCDFGKNGILNFSALDLGEEKVVVVVRGERKTRF